METDIGYLLARYANTLYTNMYFFIAQLMSWSTDNINIIECYAFSIFYLLVFSTWKIHAHYCQSNKYLF